MCDFLEAAPKINMGIHGPRQKAPVFGRIPYLVHSHVVGQLYRVSCLIWAHCELAPASATNCGGHLIDPEAQA